MSFLIVDENRTVLTGIVFNDNFAEKIGMFNSQHLNITVLITHFVTIVFISYHFSKYSISRVIPVNRKTLVDFFVDRLSSFKDS